MYKLSKGYYFNLFYLFALCIFLRLLGVGEEAIVINLQINSEYLNYNIKYFEFKM